MRWDLCFSACLCLAPLCLPRWWYLVIISACISSSILQPFWVSQVPSSQCHPPRCHIDYTPPGNTRPHGQDHISKAPQNSFELLSAHFHALAKAPRWPLTWPWDLLPYVCPFWCFLTSRIINHCLRNRLKFCLFEIQSESLSKKFN